MQATLAAPVRDHASAVAFLNGRSSRKLANNTQAELYGDNSVGIRLHGTIIVRFHPKAVELNSGGYRTSTTKSRMNSLLLRYGIYQSKGEWYVMDHQTGKEVGFFDGMTLPY